jgi:hypothetical protein
MAINEGATTTCRTTLNKTTLSIWLNGDTQNNVHVIPTDFFFTFMWNVVTLSVATLSVVAP